MKEFLNIKKNVSEEQSSLHEHKLIDSMMKKIEGNESCNKNQATLGVKLSFENQVGEEADVFKANEQPVEDKSYSLNQTDVSERSSVASKKNENSYSDNSSIKTSKLFLKLKKKFSK